MDALIISFLTLSLVFAVGWIVSTRITNVSIVDAMWVYALLIPVSIFISANEGGLARDVILLSIAAVWSLRLGSHLTVRIYRSHPIEDSRYRSLRKLWGNRSNRNFFYFFQVNALLVFLLSLPFYFASKNSAALGALEWIGLVIFLIGWGGESLADKQLSSFLKRNRSKQVCEVGLWNYSRHPNYFFEAVIWIGVYTFCSASPLSYLCIHAPLLMIFLLTKVTGIPPAEKSSIVSKGDAYRAYQKTTSPFVPWFKKSAKP